MSNSIQPTERPLRRPLRDRVFAGVSSGLGRRFDISPTWFRVGFILLALFGGIGFVLYALGWLLIPDEGSNEPIVAEWFDGFDTSNTGMVVGAVLVGVAVIILASSFHLISGKFVVAGILLVIGVLLYRGDLDRRSRPPSSGEGEPPSIDEDDESIEAEPVGDELADEGDDMVNTAVESSVESPPPPAPVRAPKPKSILGRLTVAATLIAVGGLAILDAADVLFPDPVHYVAITVAVIGAGLVVGTLFGRARWLIIVGLLLTPVLFVASVGPTWSINGEAGERYIRVESIQDLDRVGYKYELGAGVLEIDLRSFEPPVGTEGQSPIPIGAKIGAGEIRIWLPEPASAVVHGSVGIGSVDIFGHQSAGLGVSRTEESFSSGGDVMFTIEANAGVGSIVVNDSMIRWEG